jgi:hypothetical protein
MKAYKMMRMRAFLRPMMAVAAALIVLNAMAPTAAQLSFPSASDLQMSNSSDDNEHAIYVEGYITGSDDGRSLSSYPIAGAVIYFIKNQQVVNQTKSNAIGYYGVAITPGTYSVVTAAAGFQTLLTEEEFRGTRTLDRLLKKVPYVGIVPYVVNPVVETSPGREVAVRVVVENSQLNDQYVAFGLQPSDIDNKNWTGWCPEGNMIGVRSGDKRETTVIFQYNGDQRGTFVCYVLITGGPFYAKIPVVIVIKDMPYESLDLYTNYPQRTVKAGTTVHFDFSVNNKYAKGKSLTIDVEKPPGWGAMTGNGTLFYMPDRQEASSDFWVYVPKSAAPGYYSVNLTLRGQDVTSNKMMYQIKVEGTPSYEALIKGYRISDEGYPSINLSEGDAFDLPVRVYNDGDFPLDLMVTAEVGDNWAYYLNGAPWDSVKVEPGTAAEFFIRSRVPNGTTGNFTAKIYLEGNDQDTMLMAQLNVQPHKEPPLKADSFSGLLLAAGTAGVIVVALVTARKRRRY